VTYREGPVVDRSSLIQQASAALMMAKQLIELFAEGSNNIRKIGDTGNVEEISSLIGQADQIYSSLWTQLDQASLWIADLQRDTTEYQSLRAALGGGAGQGILDVGRHTEQDGNPEVVITTIEPNVAGLKQAAAAWRILATLLPEVDWVTQIKKQAATPVVDLQRGTKRLVWGTIIALVGVLAYLILR
jgi:hypothetical protein